MRGFELSIINGQTLWSASDTGKYSPLAYSSNEGLMGVHTMPFKVKLEVSGEGNLHLAYHY